MKKINLLSFVLLTFLTVTITSCSEEVNGVIDSANFIEDIENRSVEAKGTCFRLLFPIGVSLGGEDTMVDSYESLKEVIEAYKEAEGEDAERPTFVFPITLENVEGEQTVVSSQEEFEDVKSACDRRGETEKGDCFDFVYPLTVNIGGEENTFDDVEALRAAQQAYKEEAGENAERSSLVFPVSIVTTDGEQIIVNSDDELKEIRMECNPKGDRGDRGQSQCFDLVFPITVIIGGEDLVVEDYQSFRSAIKGYFEEAGEDAERPSLEFPITVSYDDETQATAESQEELDALKDACENG